MDTVELTLSDRAAQMFRRLNVLERCFRSRLTLAMLWSSRGAVMARNVRLRFAKASETLIGGLVQDARVLTSVPFPLADWRPGDAPEVDRHEVLQLVRGYEGLIASCEASLGPQYTQEGSADLHWHGLNISEKYDETSRRREVVPTKGQRQLSRQWQKRSLIRIKGLILSPSTHATRSIREGESGTGSSARTQRVVREKRVVTGLRHGVHSEAACIRRIRPAD